MIMTLIMTLIVALLLVVMVNIAVARFMNRIMPLRTGREAKDESF